MNKYKYALRVNLDKCQVNNRFKVVVNRESRKFVKSKGYGTYEVVKFFFAVFIDICKSEKITSVAVRRVEINSQAEV